MSSFNDGIEAALNALDERLTLIGGCGDGGCLVMPPKGMHTNGGCRCMWDKYKAQKTVHAYMAFVRSIRALAPAAPEPSEAKRMTAIEDRALLEMRRYTTNGAPCSLPWGSEDMT